ncbi:hypothetical protein AB4Y45_32595 [Paraburkholderia sp. EG287A]|uniref:hypothetical protein n=1 Tax=Paraburkholderia sp. EG287A TaxID=3237012 RepID=UPI0034D30DC5
MLKHVLFVCSQARLRSRTAELLCLFGGMNARCAGTDFDALAPVSKPAVEGARLVVCMEAKHSRALRKQGLAPDWMVTLAIPDRYDRLEPELVDVLIQSMDAHSPDVAEAMRRGATILASMPGYRKALGTQSFEVAENPAYRVLPSV